jgi:hypothetical protein
MRFFLQATSFLFLVTLAVMSFPADVQAQNSGSISVTCENGAEFDNGVEFVVNQMRPGFTYTATAIGVDGFDPVLAVLDENGQGLCNDDEAAAADFFANLPSTGRVPADGLTAQVQFSQNQGQMADVSLVVGGFDNTSGEFVLILEGMATTTADGLGDPFSVRLTPDLVNQAEPLSVYMIGVPGNVDPLFYLAGDNAEPFVDEDGGEVLCDDGGGNCWGENESLAGSSVARTSGRVADADSVDAMLNIPMGDFQSLDFDDGPFYLTFVMSRFEGSGTGDYVVVFNTFAGGDAQVAAAGEETEEPAARPTRPSRDDDDADEPVAEVVGGGYSVTCENGAEFDNGVEFVVNQMRPGFTYTATAIGIDGFDPVLAVLDADGQGLCNDDEADAADFFANLPSTGRVAADSLTAQVQFSQNLGEMADVSLVVGGFGNTTGEFVLILEGMASTDADVLGDPFSVRLTPGLVNSAVPLSTYMIGVPDGVDPLFYLLGENGEPLVDEAGDTILCDDGGGTCWGENESLAGAGVARTSGRQADADSFDAMLTIPMEEFRSLDFDDGPFYLTFVMTRFQGSAAGDYVIAFHAEAR